MNTALNYIVEDVVVCRRRRESALDVACPLMHYRPLLLIPAAGGATLVPCGRLSNGIYEALFGSFFRSFLPVSLLF